MRGILVPLFASRDGDDAISRKKIGERQVHACDIG